MGKYVMSIVGKTTYAMPGIPSRDHDDNTQPEPKHKNNI